MNKAMKCKELIPPSACVPNNRPVVVFTVMVCDHTWIMKMERTTINTVIMGHPMKRKRVSGADRAGNEPTYGGSAVALTVM